MAPAEPARRVRQGMSEAARRAASERMTAMRAAQRARGQAAARVEAPTPAAVVTPAGSPPPDAPPAMPETQATPARMQRLGELWMNPELTLRDLLAAVNSLPGPQVSAPTNLYRWAGRLGLPTTRPVPASALPPAPAMDISEPPPAPPPAPAPPPPPPPQPAAPGPAAAATPAAAVRRPLRPDDVWDEARDMLRAGIPVITVAEETGLTTGQVRDLKFGLSSTGAAKGAA